MQGSIKEFGHWQIVLVNQTFQAQCRSHFSRQGRQWRPALYTAEGLTVWRAATALRLCLIIHEIRLYRVEINLV